MDPYSTRRGVDPATLLGLVENTVPFLFRDHVPLTPYSETILKAAGKERFTHLEYFSLCLAAHYTTVATFVPTDVDNQIRKTLWDQDLAEGTKEAMAELCLESLSWDFRPFTARFQEAQVGGKNVYVSGHQGEWFSVAVGAYGSLREKAPPLAERLKTAVLRELGQEAEIFRALKKAGNGVGLLRACTLIAHNLGDLDRVMDQWELPATDPLRKAAYKLGHEKNEIFGPAQAELLEAGALNKAFMASENHRHYPLRKPRCLRASLELIFPLGPFTDAWGERVARHPLLETRDKIEVAEALLEGFNRLSSPKVPLFGYARALGGLQAAFPGGSSGLHDALPSRAAKALQRGELAEINRPSREQFENQWAKRALHFLKLP